MDGPFALLKIVGSIGALVLVLLGLVWLDEAFPPAGGMSPDLQSASKERNETLRTYEEYRQWSYHQRHRTFMWQARSTKLIFWVSILVAACGICLSIWQFLAASKTAEGALQAHEVEIKTQLISLAFKSRSIAALVLFMSLAYLLVYAIFIYPIRDAEGPPSDSGEQTLQEEATSRPEPEATNLSTDETRRLLGADLIQRATNRRPD